MRIYLAIWPQKKDPGAWEGLINTNQTRILLSFWWMVQEKFSSMEMLDTHKNETCI